MGTLCEKGSHIDQAGVKLNPPAPSKFSDYNHTACLAFEMWFCRHLVYKTMSDLSPTFCLLRRAHMWSARAGPFSFQLSRTQPVLESHLDISRQEFLSIEKDESRRLKKTYSLGKKNPINFLLKHEFSALVPPLVLRICNMPDVRKQVRAETGTPGPGLALEMSLRVGMGLQLSSGPLTLAQMNFKVLSTTYCQPVCFPWKRKKMESDSHVLHLVNRAVLPGRVMALNGPVLAFASQAPTTVLTCGSRCHQPCVSLSCNTRDCRHTWICLFLQLFHNCSQDSYRKHTHVILVGIWEPGVTRPSEHISAECLAFPASNVKLIWELPALWLVCFSGIPKVLMVTAWSSKCLWLLSWASNYTS